MQNLCPILVIAAAGKTGRRVADRLENLGLKVRRASRSLATPFDWNDRSTWRAALEGVSAAYIVYSPDLAVPAAPEAISAFTELAQQMGLERLVILSGRGEEEALRCERIVQNSGLEWTVVRASWFAQNFDEGDFRQLVLSDVLALPAGDICEPFIDVDDIADVVVAALTEGGHDGEVYEVTGPRLMNFHEVAREIGEARGRGVDYVDIPMADFKKGLASHGAPAEHVALLEYLFATVLDGRNAHVTNGVERALGRPAKDFTDFAQSAAQSGAWDLSVAQGQS